MNRLQHTAQPPQIGLAEPQWDLDLGRFSVASRDVPHVLFAPQHYEPNYAYPLIVWLHGPQDDERQLLRIMPLVSMRNYVAVAPRGLDGNSSRDENGRKPATRRAWTGTASRAEQRVFDSIAIARRKYHVAPTKVFAAGFDAGGTMAFHLALTYPEFFAGALSFGGALPVGRKPFRHLEQVRRLAVFMAAGEHSEHYPPKRVCNDLRLLHSAGLSITLRQYPCRHELCPQMLQDMDRWIMEQIANRSEQSSF
ncbi:MAG: dienelactone hydrolase family protein [Pirellulales bacterium]|nr:dienelactone hydrolase family protein [Pirellulales bacterium]